MKSVLRFCGEMGKRLVECWEVDQTNDLKNGC